MSSSNNRLLPIDEILSKVRDDLMSQWRNDPLDGNKSSTVRWMQDIVYYSMMTPVIYDEIVVVANEVLEEE